MSWVESNDRFAVLDRDNAAILMLENGADIRYIQQMLGHADLSTTEIYTRVSIKKLKEVHNATHPARMGRDWQAEGGVGAVSSCGGRDKAQKYTEGGDGGDPNNLDLP